MTKHLCWRRRGTLTVVLLLLVGCARPQSELSISNVHTVKPGVLIRGAQTDADGLLALQQAYGIRTVVNFNDLTTKSEAATAESLGLNYVALPASPFRPDDQQLLTFLQTVLQPDMTPVYVHCRAGMDRTGYAVATYRIVIDHWSADRALAELREYQSWPHRWLFLEISSFVRSVEADQARWRASLDRQLGPATLPATP